MEQRSSMDWKLLRKTSSNCAHSEMDLTNKWLGIIVWSLIRINVFFSAWILYPQKHFHSNLRLNWFTSATLESHRTSVLKTQNLVHPHFTKPNQMKKINWTDKLSVVLIALTISWIAMDLTTKYIKESIIIKLINSDSVRVVWICVCNYYLRNITMTSVFCN